VAPPAGTEQGDRIAVCIHCGLCLDACPTFVETGNEAESPRGRLLLLGGLEAGRFAPDQRLLAHVDRCLGCRACETACPSGVEYGRILETARSAYAAGRPPRSRLERFLVRRVLWRGSWIARGLPLYRRFRPWVLASALAVLPLPAGVRDLLRLVPEPEPPAPRVPRPASPGNTPAVLVRGCVARAMFPRTEAAMIRLLERAGYRLSVLAEPECCGALASHLGEQALAEHLAGELREALAATEGLVVFTAAGCGAHARHLGPDVGPRVVDLSVALADAPVPLEFAGEPAAVAFQEPCHLRHGQDAGDAPRRLLEAAGARVVEPDDGGLCCGSAGSYNLAERAMAARLGRRKVHALEATGAALAVTANPGCALQIRAHRGPKTPPVLTLARFLEERLTPEPRPPRRGPGKGLRSRPR